MQRWSAMMPQRLWANELTRYPEPQWKPWEATVATVCFVVSPPGGAFSMLSWTHCPCSRRAIHPSSSQGRGGLALYNAEQPCHKHKPSQHETTHTSWWIPLLFMFNMCPWRWHSLDVHLQLAHDAQRKRMHRSQDRFQPKFKIIISSLGHEQTYVKSFHVLNVISMIACTYDIFSHKIFISPDTTRKSSSSLGHFGRFARFAFFILLFFRASCGCFSICVHLRQMTKTTKNVWSFEGPGIYIYIRVCVRYLI